MNYKSFRRNLSFCGVVGFGVLFLAYLFQFVSVIPPPSLSPSILYHGIEWTGVVNYAPENSWAAFSPMIVSGTIAFLFLMLFPSSKEVCYYCKRELGKERLSVRMVQRPLNLKQPRDLFKTYGRVFCGRDHFLAYLDIGIW